MEHIDINVMIAVVEDYIYQKKNRRVSIQIRYNPFFIQHDLNLLNYCYSIAIDKTI
jgi:hypothetical protein